MAAADPDARRRSARIAADWSWAATRDRSARTLPARRASITRWEAAVDPHGEMDDATRAKAAESARRAHLRQMAEKRWREHRAKKAA